MKLSWSQLNLFCLCLLVLSNVQATNLLEAYTMARDSDPTFKAAFYAHQSGQEYKILGRSNLLPVISANYSRFKNKSDIDFNNARFSRSETRRYSSHNASVQLRQPLISFDGYARYKQGKVQSLLSDQEFAIREQELILRVFNKYAAVLYAHDVLTLQTLKKKAYERQMQANIVMFKHGEGTKTDILESQARYDLAEADIVEAADSLNNARAELNKIVGQKINSLAPLLDKFSTLPLRFNHIEDWQKLVLSNNLELSIQHYQLEMAEQQVKLSEAGHMPKLDAVLSWNNSASDTINTFNQDSTVQSIGLQLSMPIYAGGSTSARVRQSVADLYKAKEKLAEQSNAITLELQKQFNLVTNSQRKLKAYRTAVNSAELLVKATHKSIQAGTRTTLDVLNAESQLFEAKANLLLASYNYLQSYLNLKKVAGILDIDDLKRVASRFEN